MNSPGFQKKSEKRAQTFCWLPAQSCCWSMKGREHGKLLRTLLAGLCLLGPTHSVWRPCSPPYRALKLPAEQPGLQRLAYSMPGRLPPVQDVFRSLSSSLMLYMYVSSSMSANWEPRLLGRKSPSQRKSNAPSTQGTKGSRLLEPCLGLSLGRKQPLGLLLSWAPRQVVRAEVVLVTRTFSNRVHWPHRRRFCA